jgi:hypothetical protein
MPVGSESWPLKASSAVWLPLTVVALVIREEEAAPGKRAERQMANTIRLAMGSESALLVNCDIYIYPWVIITVLIRRLEARDYFSRCVCHAPAPHTTTNLHHTR